MVSEEIKETIYIAISCIIAAAVLGLCAFVIGLRSDFAATYNEQQASRIEAESYERFAGYNDKVIYGDELIALIREFWCEDVSIYIDELMFKTNSDTVPYTGNTASKDTRSDGSPGIFLSTENMVEIRNSRYGITNKSPNILYYDIEDLSMQRDTSPFNVNSMQVKGLAKNEAYYVYVVTGKYSEDEIVNAKYEEGLSFYSDVTAIVVKHIPDNSSLYYDTITNREGDPLISEKKARDSGVIDNLQKNKE